MFDHMTFDELVAAYNATEPKPNPYGAELQRRIHAEDRESFGMSADNPVLRTRGGQSAR